MVLTQGIKRLLMGGWVLVALLILAFNAHIASTVLEMPLPSHSREARMAMHKARQLEQAAKIESQKGQKDYNFQKIAAKIDEGLKKIKQKIAPPKKPVAIKKPKVVKVVKKEEVIILPKLTGIMQVFDSDGRIKLLAALDGKVYEENTSIKGFHIKQITAKGVTLARDDRTWQIKIPSVDFSVSQ